MGLHAAPDARRGGCPSEAGRGVRGGRAIGATNASGSFTAESGWARERDVRVEDVPEIVESHLVNGVPVARLLFRGHRTGNNTLVKE